MSPAITHHIPDAEAAYLDYFNNYLTVACFARKRSISEELARETIEQGRAAHYRRFGL